MCVCESERECVSVLVSVYVCVCVRVFVVQPENVRSIFGALTVVTELLKTTRISCACVCVFVDV